MLEDRRGLAGAGEASDENVVPGLIDAEAELEGPQSALLADKLDQGNKLVGAVELECVRVLLAPELFDRDSEVLGIDHERQVTSVGGIEQPAVDIARVGVEISLLEEEGDLAAG